MSEIKDPELRKVSDSIQRAIKLIDSTLENLHKEKQKAESEHGPKPT